MEVETQDAQGPDRVIDVDAENKNADETLFWKICLFCEAHLHREDPEKHDV